MPNPKIKEVTTRVEKDVAQGKSKSKRKVMDLDSSLDSFVDDGEIEIDDSEEYIEHPWEKTSNKIYQHIDQEQ